MQIAELLTGFPIRNVFQMAAVAKPEPAEDSLQDGPAACRLFSDRGCFLPDRNGPVSDKGNPAPAFGEARRNAGGPIPDCADLDSQTVSIGAELDKDEACPAAPTVADSCHLAVEIEALHSTLKRKDLLIAR